ncbi:MAG: 50S ribosomal protein L25 [Armatimonadota bacterium]|nr:50S ribosomal protein L25 [Armatimonadota bacterium]MDR5702642.1 50S ribosomal protein L25 [Armatimonadota bacterium]MDR7435967.1 50S ribosomal protein L25 [Armatimonadota bacterium]
MERVVLPAEVRTKTGKSAAKKLRLIGKIPAILYGKGRSPTPLAVERKRLLEVLHTAAGKNVLIDLEIHKDGEVDRATVMLKELQQDLYGRDVIHADLVAVSLEETIELEVPVILVGQAKGVAAGGILEQHLRFLVVECLPTQIPEHIEVDISHLDIGDTIHVSELKIPDGVSVRTPPEEVVVSILAPAKEEVPAPAEAAPPQVPQMPRAPEEAEEE